MDTSEGIRPGAETKQKTVPTTTPSQTNERLPTTSAQTATEVNSCVVNGTNEDQVRNIVFITVINKHVFLNVTFCEGIFVY